MEAEARYDLADENNEYFRESFQNVENSHFSGLSLSNKTRWNSDLKMGKSQLKNNGKTIGFKTFVSVLSLLDFFNSGRQTLSGDVWPLWLNFK